ncbi:MAG: RNA polymerase sigma factor [Planctomycetota bacterium]|nr:MAG: RNA polymerase sigma factor [Planctomycetota bacterium]
MAFQMLSHAADAEDVYQETFQRAFRYLDSYNPEYSFYTWLHKIALNEIFKEQKRRKVRREKEGLGNQDDLDFFMGQIPLNGDMAYKELFQKVEKGLSKMESRKKAVFILRVFQGLSLKEIAELLELSLDNVKVMLFRARKELAKELKGNLNYES